MNEGSEAILALNTLYAIRKADGWLLTLFPDSVTDADWNSMIEFFGLGEYEEVQASGQEAGINYMWFKCLR